MWIIRGYHFGYNDECFSKCGKYTVNKFSSQEKAEQVYKRLEIKDARQFPLKEMEFAMYGGGESLEVLDAFVYEKCGQHILDEDGELIDDVLPHQLSDNDTFEFIKKVKAYAYQLVEFSDEEANKDYWIAYLPYENTYLTRDYVNGVEILSDEKPLVYGETIQDLQGEFSLDCQDFGVDSQYFGQDIVVNGKRVYNRVNFVKVIGVLADITDNPLLLQKIIEQYPDDFKLTNTELWIGTEISTAFWAANELLKQPLVEFKRFTAKELEDEFNFII
jgi:hypothetical protein